MPYSLRKSHANIWFLQLNPNNSSKFWNLVYESLMIYISEAAQFGETGGKLNTSASYYLLISFPTLQTVKAFNHVTLINWFYIMQSAESWSEVVICCVPNCGCGNFTMPLLLKERGLLIAAHKESDSSLIFHNDIYWTHVLGMALETWALEKIYISCCKQFRWQQSHPLYKKQEKDRCATQNEASSNKLSLLIT